MPEWTDDRDEQQTLELDQDALATQDREPKIAGSARFADDSEPAADPGEQARMVSVGDDKQRTLTGDTAARTPEWRAQE